MDRRIIPLGWSTWANYNPDGTATTCTLCCEGRLTKNFKNFCDLIDEFFQKDQKQFFLEKNHHQNERTYFKVPKVYKSIHFIVHNRKLSEEMIKPYFII